MRSNQVGFIAMSLLAMVVNQSACANHVIRLEDSTNEQLPEVS